MRRVRKFNLAALAAVTITGLTGVQPARANTTGCITYIDYVWQADKSSSEDAGQGVSATTATVASAENNQCLYTNGYTVETSSSGFYWTIYGWWLCDQDDPNVSSSGRAFAYTACNDGSGYGYPGDPIGNRNIGGHRAWFAGNPWDSTTIIDG